LYGIVPDTIMKIHFILVEPKVPENVGASARALKTMGFDSLVLVNPCSWQEGKAKWVAHGSGEILDKALVFNSLSEAVRESDFIVGTTAKTRSVKHDYIPLRKLAYFINQKTHSINNLSVVFGREESGLTNEEMKLCDITSSIPMVGSFPSLNLSMAVMLYAYELSDLNLTENPESLKCPGENSVKALKRRIKELLVLTGINEDDNRYGRIMERISFLGSDDINLLHSVCNMIGKRDEGKHTH
jgi:tRNA/rRNA methyltransferase